MTTTKMVCQNQKLDWEPYPKKIHVGRYLVKDGKNLPNSMTEDIHGYSICPWYTKMHIRRIDRLHRKKIRCCGNKNLSRIQRSKRNSLESKQGLLKRAYTEEAELSLNRRISDVLDLSNNQTQRELQRID